MAQTRRSKIAKVLGEFKHGELHSGSKSGPPVKSRRQAVAIAMRESGMPKPSDVKRRRPRGGARRGY